MSFLRNEIEREKAAAVIEKKRKVRKQSVRDHTAGAANRILWVVKGVEYKNAAAAAEAYGVSTRTIRRWCNGYTAGGEFRPPRKGCYSEEDM